MSLDQQILNEFIDNCRQKDLIKARLVLDHCNRIDAVSQKRILYELNKMDNEFALPLMMFIAVRHQEALEKYPLLSESIRDRALQSSLVLKEQLLGVTGHQEAFIELVGALKLEGAIPWLVQLLETSDSFQILKASLEAVRLLKAKSAVSAVSGLLKSEDPRLIDLAVDTLGDIASEKAIQILNSLLTARDAHIRNRAKYMLVNIGESAAAVVTSNLDEKDVDLLIHSLNILQLIGHKNSVAAVRRLINSKPSDENVRFAAYEALAALPLRKGDYVLAAGLTDADYAIRLAAAKAVNQHLDESLLKGIGNMMISEDNEAEQVARAILDSQSEFLVKGLFDMPFFRRFFINYLSGSVDSALHSYYIKLLHESGNETLIAELDETRSQVSDRISRGRICAVDDSKMILKVYQSILSELSFESVLFEKPEDYLDWLSGNKPLIVFTDLNMPGMTGIELTQKTRRQFSADMLPIIMVTTQNEAADIERAVEAGVNEVLMKPFDIEKISAVLNRLLAEDIV